MHRSSSVLSAAKAARAENLSPWVNAVVGYLAIGLLLTLPGLGSVGLVKMEGMLADIAQTMLETGDFLVPRLYGEIYAYKPPLVYWMTAAAIHLFGSSEWALRVPGALATLVMGLSVLVLIGRAYRPRVGMLAAIASSTGLLWLQHLKLAEFDVVLSASVGVAVAAACYNLSVPRERISTWIWVLGYSSLAVGCLSKGIPALMAYAPGLVVAAIVTRRGKRLWTPGHLAAWWWCAVSVGTYLAFYWTAIGTAGFTQPGNEALVRGFGWTFESALRTLIKPLFVFVAFLPWSLVWFWGSKRERPTAGKEPREILRLAAWSFLVAGCITFMLVPTHETRYYLPLAVPAGIVAALGLERLLAPAKGAQRLFRRTGYVFAATALVMAAAPHFAGPLRLTLLAIGVGQLALVRLLDRTSVRNKVVYLLLTATLGAWAMETWVLWPYRARHRAMSEIAQVFDRELPPTATLWALGAPGIVGRDASLYYYLRRPTKVFRAEGALPPEGSYVLLTGQTSRLLAEDRPRAARRLDLILEVDHPRGPFLLHRIRGRNRQAAASQGQAGSR